MSGYQNTELYKLVAELLKDRPPDDASDEEKQAFHETILAEIRKKSSGKRKARGGALPQR